MASVIEFDRVALRHPAAKAPVLSNLSLAIEAGSFVSIVGGSGVGKSTLLRAAAGLLPAESGAVVSLAASRPDQRSRAFVFQDSRLLPWRTVSQNVALGLKGLALDRATARRRVADALALTGLADFGDRWPHQLSGGQAQRVGIARALAVEPTVLLMDEPFSAVDAITRQRLQEELAAIWQASGAAVIFVTHDIAEAVYLGDRVVVLADAPARIVADIEIAQPRPRYREDPAFAALASRAASYLDGASGEPTPCARAAIRS